MVEWLDKDEVVCCSKDAVAWLYEGVAACLDKNNKDDFDVDFLLAHPLEYIIEENLGGKYVVHYGHMT